MGEGLGLRLAITANNVRDMQGYLIARTTQNKLYFPALECISGWFFCINIFLRSFFLIFGVGTWRLLLGGGGGLLEEIVIALGFVFVHPAFFCCAAATCSAQPVAMVTPLDERRNDRFIVDLRSIR